ncbi:hypothetical protein DFH27DRAFT_97852 [Peziza echinospora]|nr:hypothetical protein DFH27DRAFT_97852 [Peziza echinospora]
MIMASKYETSSSRSPTKAPVPMWDSSDPARSPAPLPLNPASPQAGPTRRPSDPTPGTPSAATKKADIPMASGSPGRAQQALTHRRMTSSQPSVSELKNLIDSGAIKNQSNNTSGGKNRVSPSKDLFSSPPPLLPPLRSIKSLENNHIQSVYSLSSNDVDSLANQLVGLTNIANNLQKEMAALSRRSKDNATDLISLKEATIARDEDIRHSLRELVQGMGMLDMGSSPPPPLLLRAPSPSIGSSGGSSTFDGDYGGGTGGGGGGSRAGSTTGSTGGKPMPFGERLQFGHSAGALINKLNQAAGGGATPRPATSDFGKMGMEMQILERILRDMSTKDGENRINDSIFDLRKNVGTRQGEKELIGLVEAVRDEVMAISEDLTKRIGNSAAATESSGDIINHGEDILKVLERVTKEVLTGKGLTDETKLKIIHLTEEVEGGRIVSEDIRNELRGLKGELLGGKALSEESHDLVLELKKDVQQSKGISSETKVTVEELKAGVQESRDVMEELKSYISGLKDRLEANKIVAEETKDGVADIKGDIRGSRVIIEEVKSLVAAFKDNFGRENGDTLNHVLQELEKMNAGQTQLQLRGAADGQDQGETHINTAALGAINATVARTASAIDTLQNRLDEFSDEANESSTETKARLTDLMKFLDDVTQNTAMTTHESREARKLFEVIRLGVQTMNDRLVSFEAEVFTRLDDGVSATSVTKNYEGEDTIKERRQMWRDIREDIEELRRELNDISQDLDRKRKHDEATMLMRNNVDDSVLEILKHQKRGGEILMAQGQMHASLREKIDEVKTMIEEQVLRGILAAQKAGTEMLVTHRTNGEALKEEFLGLRALVEEQVIGQIVQMSHNGGNDFNHDMVNIKQHLAEITAQVMDKSDVKLLGLQVNDGMGEVKMLVQGLVGQVVNAQKDSREGVQSEMEEIKKLLDDVVGQVLEKQKGFGMGVLEVIKEVKKIVTDRLNSNTQEDILSKVDEVKRAVDRIGTNETRDLMINAVNGLRGTLDNTIATRESQSVILGAVADIRRIVEDKAMEGNYLGALADLREFIEEKDFMRQRQDTSVNGMIMGAVAEIKQAMMDKDMGDDLLTGVSDIKAMLEEKQIIRAQQLAREDELKHQIGLIQRILEEGVIRAIVHLQRDLGDGIRGDMAEVKEQGNDVRSDVSEMRKIMEDDVKTKMLDIKIMLEDEIRNDVVSLKKMVGEDVKTDVADIKKVLGKNGLVENESHKKTQATVKEVLEALGDLQTDMKGQHSKHFNNFQELKFLLQQQTTVAKSSEVEVQAPQLIQYDDAQAQGKLDKLVAQSNSSSKALTHLEKLPEIHTHVVDTANQIATFIAMQTSIAQDSATKQVEAAGQAILALEKARAERAIVEASTAQLKEMETNLAQTTKSLKEEVEALNAKKLALSSDVSSLNAILVTRREELDKMCEQADAIQRRVMEGALEAARQLADVKRQGKSGNQSLKRVNSTRNKGPANLQPPAAGAAAASGVTPRRHLSLNQLSTGPQPSTLQGRMGTGPGSGQNDFYSVTGGFSTRKEDLKSPHVGVKGSSLAEERESEGSEAGSGRVGSTHEGMRSSDSLAGSGVMVEDWDDKLHGEEMGLAGPSDEDLGSGEEVGARRGRGAKKYPKSLGAEGLGSAAGIAKRNMSGASMASIDE